jgi:exodeoxyribonuclease-3
MIAFDHGQATAYTQDPPQLGQGALGLGKVFEHKTNEDVVKGFIAKGQLIEVGLLEGNAGQPGRLHCSAGPGQRLDRDVDRGNVCQWALPSQNHGLRADATPRLEHTTTRWVAGVVMEQVGQHVRLVAKAPAFHMRVPVDVVVRRHGGYATCQHAPVFQQREKVVRRPPAASLPAVKLISWNVNGLRAVMKRNFLDYLGKEKPDVLCLQETKCGPDDVDGTWPKGYAMHWNAAEKKGYSGTAILTKVPPLHVYPHMGLPEHDHEGRVLTAEFVSFYLVNVYVPNAKRDLSRLPYRQRWDHDFLAYLKQLEKRKPVVFCGDLNVAHTEIDLTHPKTNQHNHGFTPEERAGFDGFVKAGFLDTFRVFTPSGGHYTWWRPFGDARAKNVGWRIDYFLASGALRPRLKNQGA